MLSQRQVGCALEGIPLHHLVPGPVVLLKQASGRHQPALFLGEGSSLGVGGFGLEGPGAVMQAMQDSLLWSVELGAP